MWSEEVLTLIVSTGAQSCNKLWFFHFRTPTYDQINFSNLFTENIEGDLGFLLSFKTTKIDSTPTHIVYHQATTKHQITAHHLLLKISLLDALPNQPLDLQVTYFTIYSSLTILTLQACLF
jgi:hypothetical protein